MAYLGAIAVQQKQRNLGRPRHDQQDKPTKSIILEVATKLFLQNGYKIVSMDDIAKACNLTKATIYYYYSTKAELYTDCMIVMMDYIREQISNILNRDELPLKSRFHQLIKIHLSATEDIDLNNFMRDAKISLSEEQKKKMKQSEEKMHEIIQHTLMEAMEKGEIPQHDPKFVTQLFTSLLNVGNHRDENGQAFFTSIDDMAKNIGDFFWKGLGV